MMIHLGSVHHVGFMKGTGGERIDMIQAAATPSGLAAEGAGSARSGVTGRSSVIPADELVRLSDVGRVVYLEGQYVDVSGFYLPGYLAAGPPVSGSPEHDAFVDRLLDELVGGATVSGEWAMAGAMHVAKDFLGADGMSHPKFVELVDRALPFMASAGVSRAVVPMFLLGRWSAVQSDLYEEVDHHPIQPQQPVGEPHHERLAMDFTELRRINAGSLIGEFVWSPTSVHLALAAGKAGLQVWEIESGERTMHVESTVSVDRVAWSPDGRRLAAGLSSGEVRMFDAETGHHLMGVKGHEREVSSIEYTPTGEGIATGGFDGSVRVWDSQDLTARSTFAAAADGAVDLAWSPRGDSLVTVGGGSAVKVWDPTTGRLQGELIGVGSHGAAVAYASNGKYLAWGGMDQTIRVWDVAASTYPYAVDRLPHSITDLSFSENGVHLAAYTETKVHIIDLRTGSIVAALPVASGYMKVRFSPNGDYLACGAGLTDVVQVWAVSS